MKTKKYFSKPTRRMNADDKFESYREAAVDKRRRMRQALIKAGGKDTTVGKMNSDRLLKKYRILLKSQRDSWPQSGEFYSHNW